MLNLTVDIDFCRVTTPVSFFVWVDSDGEPEPRPVDGGAGRRPTRVEGVTSAGASLCTGKIISSYR